MQDEVGEVRVIAPLTVAVQDGGKRRLCWNGRPTNVGLDAKPFRMEHVQTVARMMRPGDLIMTLDLKAGYHQFPVTPWFQKFLCFQWEGEIYRWKVMPFGLSTAPRAFSKLTRALVKRWRLQGIRCSNYIDDFALVVKPEEVDTVRATVLRDLQDLGLFVSIEKSMLRPGTMAKYLGVLLCTVPMPHLRMPDAKVVKLRDALRRIIAKAPEELRQHQARQWGVAVSGEVCGGYEEGDGEVMMEGVGVRVKGRTLARLLGVLQFFKVAVPMVAVFTKELYTSLNTLPLSVDGWLDFDQSVLLSGEALQECFFWYHRVKVWNGFAVRPRTVTRVLYTDGSGSGYGGVLHRVLSRRMEPATQLVSGVWEAYMPTDSVVTELQGLWRALVAAGGSVLGQVVLHRTDSISTYWVLRNGRSRSQRLHDIVRRILVYCAVARIHLAMEYVGADVIIKSGADALSRAGDESDCRLNEGVFGRLWRLCGGFQVDRFATGGSVQKDVVLGQSLPYWSLYADGAAEGVDALTADWRGVRNYAFPPVKIVGQVLELVLEQAAWALVIVPKWPSQWWWPLVVREAWMIVDLQPLLADDRMFSAVRGNGLFHPLGKCATSPYSTEWVAVWFKPGARRRPSCGACDGNTM